MNSIYFFSNITARSGLRSASYSPTRRSRCRGRKDY